MSLIVAAIVVAVAGVCAIPLARVVGSERAGTLLLVIALAVFFHLQSPVWWPPARPLAAVIARAYVVASDRADPVLNVPLVVPASAPH